LGFVTKTGTAASYHDIADALRHDITSGDLAPGAPVPSQAEVAARFAVSPGTARLALDELVNEGLITGGRGRGRRVRDRSPLVVYASRSESAKRRTAAASDAWVTDVEEQGRKADQAITVEIVQATADIARWLQVDEGQVVAVRRRVRTIDGEPDNLCDSYYPMDLTAQVPEILNPADVPQGVIRVMRERGYEQVRYVDELRWRPATPEESTALNIPRGVAVLVQTRVGYTADRPVRATVAIWPGDSHAMIYELPA
jgi:GntR family transcriptional regulator